MSRFEYIESKTILSKLKDAPDPYFGITYNINLYRGCQHGCIYCDSRSDVYRLEDLSRIRIKINSLSLLETALKKRIKKGTIGTGSMNDPYMPVEKEEKLTREALKIIEKYKYPVHILTKSNLVERDTDIIKEIGKEYSAVSFTITTPHDTLSKTIEPYAPVSTERLKALLKLSSNGIYSGVLLMPILPFITDKRFDIEELIKKCADNGANYILFLPGMTLRKGQKEYYYSKLDENWPGLADKYERKFKFQYACHSDNHKQLWDIFSNSCIKYNIAMKMNFYQQNLPTQQSLF